MPGCQASSNSSQYDLEEGVFWRLTLMMTDLCSAIFHDSSRYSWSPGRPRPGRSATKLTTLTTSPLRWADEGVRPPCTPLLRRVILPRPRRNQRHIHRFELKLRLVRIRRKICFRRLQEILVVAIRKVRLVMRPARFVPQARALSNHPRQLQHVIKLPRKYHAGIRPLRAVAQIHSCGSVPATPPASHPSAPRFLL